MRIVHNASAIACCECGTGMPRMTLNQTSSHQLYELLVTINTCMRDDDESVVFLGTALSPIPFIATPCDYAALHH